ncbi:glutamine synthetase family protein [Brevibacillus massiliensis]|jgi:glutamine synthetase|uniref:glutamine synthetase family protein n=1 Tax=Brevibacillus massiliensis TaxID=1118054 RepID=UPI000308361D|nr:glutamine synthetase family protein [Brevibacillus massiliensis]
MDEKDFQRYVQQLIQEQNIRTVRVAVTDNSNIPRSRFVPARFFLEKVMREGLTFPSALYSMDTSAELVEEAGDGYAGGYPSWLMKPDLSTFVVLPWANQTARVIADLFDCAGEPIVESPRYQLERVLRAYEEEGFRVRGAFEFEFFVYNKMTLQPAWSGLNCYSDVVQAEVADILEDLQQGLSGIGAGPEVANTEYGSGQFEVTNSPFEGKAIADMAYFYRMGIKEILSQKGWQATFMSKPDERMSGSGGHFHLSLLDRQGRNLFYDQQSQDGLSALARWFIAGQIEHAAAVCALCNGTVNSYKRLVPGTFAPTHAAWGYEHRSAMIRIPFARGEAGTHLENRLPGADTNPYLAMAAILLAGLDGIRRRLEPPAAAVGVDLYRQPGGHRPLPARLDLAVEALLSNEWFTQFFGSRFIRHYASLRQNEWQRYQRSVSEWERNEYFHLF